jgi:ABC-type multidrug transport system ATPase subunit
LQSESELPQVETRGLTKIYPGGRGLHPLDLKVQRGEFVAIVGHNGAGKSTLLKILAGWIRQDSGEAWISGVSIQDRLMITRKLGFVPETPNLYEQFSVLYNLRLFARLFSVSESRINEVLHEFALEDLRKSKVQTLSKGMRQRVNLSRCLLADPDVLLFDEPSSGLDFEMSKELYRRLGLLHAAGKTILFTSHRPEEVQQHATRMLVLHGGSTVFDGIPCDYFKSQVHQELYR